MDGIDKPLVAVVRGFAILATLALGFAIVTGLRGAVIDRHAIAARSIRVRRYGMSAGGVTPGLVERLIGPIAHRGPDDCGTWVDADAGIGLGHRRFQ